MTNSTSIKLALIAVTIFALASGSAFADKPAWAGNGKHEKHKKKAHDDKYEKDDKQGKQKGDADARYSTKQEESATVTTRSRDRYFTDQQRTVVRDYYAREFQAGNCPPGLAKKDNGCMPPGQAKKWAIGKPLPKDVVVYELPPEIVIQLGKPPFNQRFVRVDSDILLIAEGTGMIIDAIENLTGK